MISSYRDLISILTVWQSGGANITVTYEALDSAAAEVLTGTQRLEGTCDQLSTLCSKMAGYWESEVRELHEAAMREQLEQIQQLCQHFRTHAAHLQTIAANYIKTGNAAAARIEGLSSDVIV